MNMVLCNVTEMYNLWATLNLQYSFKSVEQPNNECSRVQISLPHVQLRVQQFPVLVSRKTFDSVYSAMNFCIPENINYFMK